ncbi:MAG TPA: TIGR03619 family F420-dependent LLM class oxidoreductase, partial [Dehalococcoidia bacterium]|nr:TIGR03619 family F420-dependent LLM class oxidoreductase [Dehalococcoidia bacterium]
SDHVAIPRDAAYPPSAYIIEPLIALSWAAAATKTIGLGTTVLIVSMRQPVVLAKMLSSIDVLSGGRVIVGAASGWLEKEFDSLGVKFADRGQRCDEAIDIMRRCWDEDPIDLEAPASDVKMVDMRMKPQPGRKIQIWVGGHSGPAIRRAIERGDGWHGGFQSAEATAPFVEKLRAGRPEEAYTLSMRTRWDALEDDGSSILKDLEDLERVGIQHVVAEPRQRDLDSWLRCGEAFARILEKHGRAG